MKRKNAVFFALLFAGAFLMAFFGSEIERSIGHSEGAIRQVMLPAFGLGIIAISASMRGMLTSRVRELEAKVQILEKRDS